MIPRKIVKLSKLFYCEISGKNIANVKYYTVGVEGQGNETI